MGCLMIYIQPPTKENLTDGHFYMRAVYRSIIMQGMNIKMLVGIHLSRCLRGQAMNLSPPKEVLFEGSDGP